MVALNPPPDERITNMGSARPTRASCRTRASAARGLYSATRWNASRRTKRRSAALVGSAGGRASPAIGDVAESEGRVMPSQVLRAMVPRHDARRAACSRRPQANPDTLEVRWRRELREGDACDTARAGPKFPRSLTLPRSGDRGRNWRAWRAKRGSVGLPRAQPASRRSRKADEKPNSS